MFAMICNDLFCKIVNLPHVPKTVLHYRSTSVSDAGRRLVSLVVEANNYEE